MPMSKFKPGDLVTVCVAEARVPAMIIAHIKSEDSSAVYKCEVASERSVVYMKVAEADISHDNNENDPRWNVIGWGDYSGAA
jgi:Cu/Ag efflux pump CusA